LLCAGEGSAQGTLPAGAKNGLFEPFMHKLNATFYQDRLGTNIGKTHPKDPSNLQITYDQVFAAGGSSKPEAKL
jgi:hypothetical protein